MKLTNLLLVNSIIMSLLLCSNCKSSIVIPEWEWETIETDGIPVARHEAGLAAYKDKIYLMGGRQINPTSEFDTRTNTWLDKSPTPVELHHFQPVVLRDAIYLIGAMTGGWPNEKPLDRVIIYFPERDEYVYSHTIPEHRRRGGAGVVVYDDKIYIVGGITNGHMDGYKPWLDEYNPATGEWRVLPDAPISRDHFQAVVLNDKLYAFAGRTTSKRTDEDMALTVEHGNIFDFKSELWETVEHSSAIPTMRAGNSAFTWQNEIVIAGGESTAHVVAHNEVEAYDPTSRSWRTWPQLRQGRHGTGLVVVGDHVYTASGCGNRGGEPELSTIERLKLPSSPAQGSMMAQSTKPVYSKWHTVTLPFEGPLTAESASDNPFLNYRLIVTFTHTKSDKEYSIRGFYAADGHAAETSADAGNIWKVRFTPDQLGDWTYKATLHHGKDIALNDDISLGELIEVSNDEGAFVVTPPYKDGADFKAHGRLVADKGYFRFLESGKYWLKGGTNSPENFLAFEDFDGTYRIKAEASEGEATAPQKVHKYEPHLKDWKTGDPTWQDGKGKGIVGAVNYLASKEMNSIYFLTLNILGDGKDVWPYRDANDFSRFDVSKLDQWEILFQHMQSKGILLHMVTQETENEVMLDEGDTGPQRQLYFRELIARFGHHLALVWNLGEENGPAPWSPIGQDDAQRKAMTSFLKTNDPYNHPVLLHTHSHDPLRSDILSDILGYKDLDGLSLQVDHREGAGEVVQTWRENARKAGHEWLITMDEIGEWHTGVLSDDEDPGHPTIRHYALWGTMMSGAAGVEWYFGAKHPSNDLSSEDWRQRDELWDLTDIAHDFFEMYLPYWEMKPDHDLVNIDGAYCLRKEDEVYAIYLPKGSLNTTIDLESTKANYKVQWYDPLKGGSLQEGSVLQIVGNKIIDLGNPPESKPELSSQDWVILLNLIPDH